jgi:cytidylate kinase
MAKEMPPSTLLGHIAEALERTLPFGVGFEGAYLPAWEIPLNDARYFQARESVVKELARNPSIVILARGSHFILRDDPKALHVMVVAPMEVRLKRVMQDLKLDQAMAKREIARFDKSGREFSKRYYKTELEDPVYYDLVINSERFSFDTAASMIVEALSFKDRAKGAQS